MQLPVYAADGFAVLFHPVEFPFPFPFFVKGVVKNIFKHFKLLKKQFLDAGIRVAKLNANDGHALVGLHFKINVFEPGFVVYPINFQAFGR